MSYFAVTREAGPAWRAGGSLDQPGVAEHAAFMNGLADDGFVLVAGPLAGSDDCRLKALLLVKAEDEAEIHRRLDKDPWVSSGCIVTTGIDFWTPIVGEQRLACDPAARQAR